MCFNLFLTLKSYFQLLFFLEVDIRSNGGPVSGCAAWRPPGSRGIAAPKRLPRREISLKFIEIHAFCAASATFFQHFSCFFMLFRRPFDFF